MHCVSGERVCARERYIERFAPVSATVHTMGSLNFAFDIKTSHRMEWDRFDAEWNTKRGSFCHFQFLWAETIKKWTCCCCMRAKRSFTKTESTRACDREWFDEWHHHIGAQWAHTHHCYYCIWCRSLAAHCRPVEHRALICSIEMHAIVSGDSWRSRFFPHFYT